MALGRKMLAAMGIEAGVIDQIIEAHSETVNALQGQIGNAEAEAEKARVEAEKYKAEAAKAAELEKKARAAEREAETAKQNGAEYERLKKEFEEYKAGQEKAAADARKEATFREWLKGMGVSDKGISMIMKWQGVDGVELDDDGKIANAKDLRKSVKEDWGEFIVKQSTEGADTPNPPNNTGGPTKTKEEILNIKDTSERQRAMAENHELFGF